MNISLFPPIGLVVIFLMNFPARSYSNIVQNIELLQIALYLSLRFNFLFVKSVYSKYVNGLMEK